MDNSNDDYLTRVRNNLKGQSDAYVKSGGNKHIFGCSYLCAVMTIGVMNAVILAACLYRAIFLGMLLTDDLNKVVA